MNFNFSVHLSLEYRSERKKGEDNCPKVKILEEKTRVLEDQSDHHHQRSLKGKFLISSLKDKNVISDEKKLQADGKSIAQYVTELIFSKLGVRVKESEIISCHYTSSGLLIFRLGDFKPGSSFSSIVTANQERPRKRCQGPLHQLCAHAEKSLAALRGQAIPVA